MKVGDRVFVSFVPGEPATIVGRLEDDMFRVRLDKSNYVDTVYSDEMTPMTKLHKLLAGEDDA